MIKNSSKSLMALVCAVIFALASCKKDSVVLPEKTSSELSTAVSPGLTTNAINSTAFELGVNGHPLGDLAYLGIPASVQVEMIKKLGMGIYRIDIMTTSDGSCTVPKVLQPLLDAAAAGKITLLPMLTPRTLKYADSEEDAYQNGKLMGANFAAKYGNVFKYYDLGNDMDVKSILSGKDGRVTEDYDRKKLVATAAYLKGMSEGIHENDNDAQTMISAGWVHWGFIKFCEAYGVKYDILAYHWYSDMEAAIARSPSLKITDITLTLNNLFPGKPIWITETNFRPADLSTMESDQNKFLTAFIAKCKVNPTVKAVLVYELFDEPYKKGDEQHYGIVKWASLYSDWLYKQVAETFQKLLANPVPVVTEPVPAAKPPVVTELVTNLVGYNSSNPQLTNMTAGTIYYSDRDYQVKAFPAYLNNATLIKTANDDKVSKVNSFMSFSLTKAATVYVAYDPRAKKLPNWLQDFKKVADKFEINDPKLASMNIYKKEYATGNITLGGNMSGAASGALCQYIVMIK